MKARKRRVRRFTRDAINAQLIASAAPEMLKELKHLLSLLGPVEYNLNIPGLTTLNGLRAVIAKAEGTGK